MCLALGRISEHELKSNFRRFQGGGLRMEVGVYMRLPIDHDDADPNSL
jgi:hypothetical protein